MNQIISSNETLLDIAKQHLKVAKAIEMSYPNDDGMINHIGYHIQQSIELSLKHILEIHNIKYPKTHEISDLIALVPACYQGCLSEIDQNSREITHLESDTRYLKSFYVSHELVKTATKLAYKLIEDVENTFPELFATQEEIE